MVWEHHVAVLPDYVSISLGTSLLLRYFLFPKEKEKSFYLEITTIQKKP